MAQNIGANAVVLTSAKTQDGVIPSYDGQRDACPLTGQYLRVVIEEMCGKIAAGMDIPVYEPSGSGVSVEIEMSCGGDETVELEISRRPTVGDLVTLTNSSDDQVYVIASDDHDGEPYTLRTQDGRHHGHDRTYYREDQVQLASGAGQKPRRLTVGDRVVRSDGASGGDSHCIPYLNSI